MYALRPRSIRSLQAILERETLGQRARFERFAAEMLYIIAAGKRIDTERTERFSAQLDQVYKNPFERRRAQPQTAAEIKAYILERVEELIDGSDDPGGEDRPG